MCIRDSLFNRLRKASFSSSLTDMFLNIGFLPAFAPIPPTLMLFRRTPASLSSSNTTGVFTRMMIFSCFPSSFKYPIASLTLNTFKLILPGTLDFITICRKESFATPSSMISTSVSYTHLDVYKRQVRCCFCYSIFYP